MSIEKDKRLFIFPTSRSLTSEEMETIGKSLGAFLQDWKAHGVPLSAEYRIDHGRFIIVVLDEKIEPASGCSIDALSSFVKHLDIQHHLGISKETRIYYKDKNEVRETSLPEFRDKVKSGECRDIEVFDLSRTTLRTYEEGFLLPLEQSWAKRYL